MTARLQDPAAAQVDAIPLLDASSLPSADDWALIESINAYTDTATDFEEDFDRFGRIRLSAAYDE